MKLCGDDCIINIICAALKPDTYRIHIGQGTPNCIQSVYIHSLKDKDLKRVGFILFTRSNSRCVGTEKDEPGEAEAIGGDVIPGGARNIVVADLFAQQQLAVLKNFNLLIEVIYALLW